MPPRQINEHYYVAKVGQNSFWLDRQLGPYAGASVRRANAKGALYELEKDVAQNIYNFVSLDMQGIVQAVAQGTAGEVGQVMEAFAKTLKSRWTRRVGLKQVHQRLGLGAQRAMLAVYGHYHSGGQARNSYRKGDRDSGGKLVGALENPSNILATTDGLLLFNKSLLDRQARQWYRLNFGAGIRAQKGSNVYPLRFGGAGTAVSLSLRQYGPSAGFRIPPGVFSSSQSGTSLAGKLQEFATLNQRVRAAKGTFGANAQQKGLLRLDFLFKPAGFGSYNHDPFIPLSHIPGGGELRQFLQRSGYLVGPKLTQGIRGEQWFDASLKYLSTALPREYLTIFDKWLTDSQREARGPAYKVGITGPAAADIQVSVRDLLKT